MFLFVRALHAANLAHALTGLTVCKEERPCGENTILNFIFFKGHKEKFYCRQRIFSRLCEMKLVFEHF